jgi:threonine/homoserine/homoserine lactone efflux protein
MYQVSQEYYDQPAAVYTAAGITPVGDLYRYGGWITVVLGMFILGCGVRLLDRAMNIRENPHTVFLVLILFPTLVVAESGWVAIFSGILSTIFIWVLSVAIAFRPRTSA